MRKAAVVILMLLVFSSLSLALPTKILVLKTKK